MGAKVHCVAVPISGASPRPVSSFEENATQTEQSSLDDPSGARRRQLVAYFLAATFGLMVLVSGPLGRFLPAPFRALFSWTNPFEKFAHPGQEAGKAPLAIGAGGKLAVIAPAGGTGSVPGPGGPGPGGPTPGKTPNPPSGGGSTLRDSLSPLDLETVALLQQAVDTFGVDQVLERLLRMTDMPTATETLVTLAGLDQLDDIPLAITPSQLHSVLVELRANLPKVLKKLEKHAPTPSASGHSKSHGHGDSEGSSHEGHHSNSKRHSHDTPHKEKKDRNEKKEKKDHSKHNH